MTFVSLIVTVLAVLSVVTGVPRPVLRITSEDSSILKDTGSHIYTKKWANITLTCTGSSPKYGSPDLDIGGDYVTSNGSLASVLEQTEFSGEVNVKFCSDAACDVTTVTITNLARTTTSTETALKLKCKETRVGDSNETIVSIFTGKWGEWKCDPDRCSMMRKKDCLNPEKEICEEIRKGCQGTDIECSEIPTAIDVTVTQSLVGDSVAVTVNWRPSNPADGITVMVMLKVNGVTKISHSDQSTFSNLKPDTLYEGSVVLINKAKRRGEETLLAFRTLPQYLTMNGQDLSRESELTISWVEVEGCKENNATVYINGKETLAGADTSFSFLYDQKKPYSIKVVSRGCGDILSPDIPLQGLNPVTELICTETSSVKCSYTTKVDFTLTCDQFVGEEVKGGNRTTYKVADEQGEVIVKELDVCSSMVRVACKAESRSGAITAAEDVVLGPSCKTEPRQVSVTTRAGHQVLDPENSSQRFGYSIFMILLAFVVFNL